MPNRFFADLHSHITLFPYNLKEKNTEGMIFCKDTPPYTAQSDISKLAKSGVRIVFASLYPIEKGFMKFRHSQGELADFTIHFATGFPESRINEIQGNNHSYFGDLVQEYEFLKKYENTPLPIKDDTRTCKYKIINNFTELKHYLKLSDAYEITDSEIHIAVILTIEGGHSLLPVSTEVITDAEANDLKNDITITLFEEIKKNIDWVKSNNVFTITFAHHFYNFLCGQAISFTQRNDWMLDQEDTLKVGFSALGEAVLHELLRTENGKRPIILDVKHLSVASRNWFYSQEKYKDIPIIASHTAVNGAKDIETSAKQNDTHTAAQTKYDESGEFNNWDINLSNQEIIEIARRKGLIGLSIDKRIIMGKGKLDSLKHETNLFVPQMKKNKIWSEPVFNNIIHIATTLKNNNFADSELWDTMAIGSDFDGMINPLKEYSTVEQYPSLRENLLLWFIESKNKIAVLKGKTDAELSEIVVKVTNKNCLQFLERNFV